MISTNQAYGVAQVEEGGLPSPSLKPMVMKKQP